VGVDGDLVAVRVKAHQPAELSSALLAMVAITR
jgi:hypothetical protein